VKDNAAWRLVLFDWWMFSKNIWQNTLILCLGLDHFMTKQTDTMSEDWLFHDKTDWYYVWGLTISWQNRLILFWGLTKYQSVLSWNDQAPDIVSVCVVMKCSRPRHSINLFCHEIFTGAWAFHHKTDWYYVWDLTISWQNRLILCLRCDHFMT
jgi:hypothetical protein